MSTPGSVFIGYEWKKGQSAKKKLRFQTKTDTCERGLIVARETFVCAGAKEFNVFFPSTRSDFDNRNFEGESFFNKSSVSHVKHVTMKSNSRWREKSPFHITYGNFTVDKALFVHTCHQRRWRFPRNKHVAKQASIHFSVFRGVPQVLFDANQKEYVYCGK